MICRMALPLLPLERHDPCSTEAKGINMMRFTMLLPALLAAAPAAAEQFQSTRLIDTIVAQYVGQPIGAVGGARTEVDARLKLASCPAPQLEWRDADKTAVIVRCMAPEWRIFVPLNAITRVKPEPAAAMVPVARPEPVIRRGDPVTVEAGSAGFSITRDGIAMGDAPVGGRLLIRIDEKKPPIQAVALEPGKATLPGWTE
jgi:flagella basal body P-ring formation protein FlgA